ncbi:hypothetical protein [Flavobacterium taihuense]|uniref:Uncharacterized protein n=1 Tax=Flavobacterium taihuense TaxID=2857508 RepID=A0ABS6XX14_9FLAO|nr:hypothetical protein [Flavobacterium taihuense]MBW4361226.1 hypothetical protein [Flavobacterium taihuense]
MKNTIQTIIQSVIPNECVFDAHTIINYLIQNHNNIYLSSNKNNWTTEFYHSEISKTIATFEDSILKRLGESWSININKQFSQNKCRIKL